MRILIAGRGYDSAGEHEVGVFELDQARALRDAGHDVRFAALDTRSIRHSRPFGLRRYALDGIEVYYCAYPAGARPAALASLAQRRASEKIWRQLETDNWRPDVVHAHFGAAMLHEAREHGVPTVYTEHFSGANRDDVSDSELAREKSVAALSDRVICVSRPLADRIQKRTGAETIVVQNIVDAAFSRPIAAREKSGNVFSFVSAGSLIHRKGHDLTLRALAQLREKSGTEITLTVIGEGEERSALTLLAEKLGIADRVVFTGLLTRGEMVGRYEDADAFVLASRRETFGVVYIEAMAMGLPVIASRCGGPEDYVNDTNGFLVPTESVDSLACAMMKMVAERARFDSAAIARAARESFAPHTVAAQLAAVYEELQKC